MMTRCKFAILGENGICEGSSPHAGQARRLAREETRCSFRRIVESFKKMDVIGGKHGRRNAVAVQQLVERRAVSTLALELRPRGVHSGLPTPHANTVRSISQ